MEAGGKQVVWCGLTLEYVSMVRRSAACASVVMVSASSRMMILKGGQG